MNFIEAIKAVEQQKKVKRKDWSTGAYLFYDGCSIRFHSCKETCWDATFMKDDYLTDDWEIVEEKKSLSEEIFFSKYNQLRCISVSDLKLALKEFLESIDDEKSIEYQWELAKRIFGEELIGDTNG